MWVGWRRAACWWWRCGGLGLEDDISLVGYSIRSPYGDWCALGCSPFGFTLRLYERCGRDFGSVILFRGPGNSVQILGAILAQRGSVQLDALPVSGPRWWLHRRLSSYYQSTSLPPKFIVSDGVC